MLFSTVTALVISLASLADANPNRLASNDAAHVPARRWNHRQVAQHARSNVPAVASSPMRKRATTRKRNSCTASSSSTGSYSSSSASNSTSTSDDDSDDSDSESDDGDDGDDSTSSSSSSATSTKTSGKHHTSTASSSAATSTSTGNSTLSSSSGGSSSGGVVHVTDPTCGSNNPSATTTKGSGPNGEESWFNCGLNGGGWTPPMLKLEQMVYVSLEDALKMENTPYKPCESYVDKFNQYGQQYGLPPVMLAAFAMQESTCNNNIYDPAGTIGMFQLAPENCPDGVDCSDLDNNIKYACELIVQYLKDAGENVLGMVGNYNGWYTKMTASKAKEAPCDEQQNLDYLQQWANAWMQGLDGYNVGTIQNCSGNFGKKKRSLYVPRFARSAASRALGWHF